MSHHLALFWIMLRAALLSTTGTGNLPIVHQDLLSRGWATDRQFAESLAIGQISPGPTGLWVISLGYFVGGLRGAADGPGALRVERAALPAPEFLRMVWNTPTVLILMGAFVCSNFVAVVLLSWMPKFLYDKFQMSLAMAGLTATIFVQLASLVGSVAGGWLADHFRKRTRRARMAVQAVGVLCGAPFVAMCGLSHSVGMLVFALTAWGFFKGLYDSNIWASLFDVVRPAARGTASGVMNCVGWLGGGGSAPLLIGIIAQRKSLGLAIALASVVYIASGILLLVGIVFFVNRDSARTTAELEMEARI